MHPALDTRLCSLLGIRYPIIQTGMGWVAQPRLVAATCNAGAIGFLATATIPPNDVDAAIAQIQELTPNPFGVNFLMEAPGADRVVDAIIRRAVPVASFGRGPRQDFVDRLKSAGVLCVTTVGAVRHAEKAAQLGADVLIAQGAEGGGHTGSVPSSILLPQVTDAVDTVVVGAGGFRDGRGLVAALAFGASGVAMGTRFLLTAESPVAAVTKQRYLDASVTDTVVTRAVDGLPQRLIRNEVVAALESGGPIRRYVRALRSALAYRQMTGASLQELLQAGLSLRSSEKLSRAQVLMAANAPILVRTALVEGRPSEGVIPTGQVAGLILDLPTCAELIERIISEADATLRRLNLRQQDFADTRAAQPSEHH
jgi:NAD(P)H-dependent flavin oxidoreductase YrpB (nitropropane dioxygenase family)